MSLHQELDGTLSVDHEWCAECLQGVERAIPQSPWLGGPNALFKMEPCGHFAKFYGQP